ncbi:MAG TPA: MmcQ/YjbR family DNA-binding protein [Thermoanaerobaculia bacterium]|nr:MmcQ/YjbR family DNA-binding protein [Thermoanaerobaculia bacterium]
MAPTETDDRSLQRLRAICAALPDTTEVAAWRHPTFRVGGKTFVAYEVITGRPSIAFRVDRDQGEILLEDPRFFATPYGRGLWVSLWADRRVPWKLVTSLARESYTLMAPKVRQRPKAKK